MSIGNYFSSITSAAKSLVSGMALTLRYMQIGRAHV